MPEPELSRAITCSAFMVLAGGRGSRVGADTNKAYLPLAGRATVSWSFAAAAQVTSGPLLLVTRPQDRDLARHLLDRDLPRLPIELVTGGSSRHASEQSGLSALSDRIRSGLVQLVSIHDAARPLAGPDLLRRVLTEAELIGGALPVTPAEGLLRLGTGGRLLAGGNRELVRVQTPQAFRAADLLAAFAAAAAAGQEGTDTASIVEAFSSLPVSTVPGGADNFKITYPEDVAAAGRLLADRAAASAQ
jgi:2-C-methyl-D-erythritol 4-phosphate cytidylyltransferase